MKEQIEKIINEEVGPLLASHGGSVELVNVTEENMVQVKLAGACGGCPGAAATLKNVVEQAIRAKVPDIAGVEAV